VAEKAAEIYHRLRKNNQIIEFRDIFIAATCLTFNLPIATLNKKHFKRIEGLKILR
jgi:predicted nucleic acid-binding protein